MVVGAMAAKRSVSTSGHTQHTDVGMDFAAKNSGKLENNWL